MNEQRTLFKYNPGLMDQEQLRSTFVGRESLLSDLIRKIQDQTTAATYQHYLLIGPRGIGKTNTLLMLRDRLLSDSKLSKAWVPVLLSEEDYSIYGFCDFFARILQLAAAEDGGAYDDLIEQLPKGRDEEGAQDKAVSLLREFSARCSKRLVVFVDNLDAVLGDQMLDDVSLRKLRSLLMNESLMLLIGTSTTIFDEIADHDRPFYQFFEALYLSDLREADIEDLMKRRAEYEKNEPFLAHFDEHKRKIRVIMELTGGNPRLVLMLYEVLTENPLIEVINALSKLLDELTPYFKAKMEALPLQQRKVVDTLMRAGGGAAPSQVAKAVGWSQPLVNAQFKRLREGGVIRVRPTSARTRATQYIVSDQLFRIWYQMRYLSEGRQRVGYIVEFVKLWYSAGEAMELVRRLERRYEKVSGQGDVMAAEDCVERISYLIDSLPHTDSARRHAALNLLRMFRLGRFQAALDGAVRAIAADTAAGMPQETPTYYGIAAACSVRLKKWPEAMSYAAEGLKRGARASSADLAMLHSYAFVACYFTRQYASAVSYGTQLLGTDLEHPKLLNLLASALSKLGQHQHAVRQFRRVEQLGQAVSSPDAARSLARIGEWDEALRVCLAGRAEFPDSLYLRLNALECLYHLGRSDDAGRLSRELLDTLERGENKDTDFDDKTALCALAVVALDNADDDLASRVARTLLGTDIEQSLSGELGVVLVYAGKMGRTRFLYDVRDAIVEQCEENQAASAGLLLVAALLFRNVGEEGLPPTLGPDAEQVIRQVAALADDLPTPPLLAYEAVIPTE